MKDTELFKKCIAHIIEFMGWGHPNHWKDRDFINLSYSIDDKTGVSLSKNTLKNVFRSNPGQEQYFPQLATRDALSQFLGYDGWRDYVKKNSISLSSKKRRHKRKPNRLLAYLLLFLVVISVIVLLSKSTVFKTTSHKNNYELQFIAMPTEGKAPLTVTYQYDISLLPFDSVFINHRYEHHKMGFQKQLLKNNKGFINHCYQIPNHYPVVLEANGTKLAAKKIHVISDGWISMVSDRFSEKQEEGELKFPEFKHLVFNLYNISMDTNNDGRLYISPEKVKQLDINLKFYYTEFRNIRNFNCSGDSCMLEVCFKNPVAEGGISCFDSQFILQCDTSFAKVTIVEPGCHRYANAVIGRNFFSGETEDLSSFAFDLSYWRTLKIKTQDGKMTFYMDDKEFFSKPYHFPLQAVTGLIFTFKGSGSVDWVKLYNAGNQLVYSDTF